MLEGENPFLIFCLNEYICILKKNRCRVWGAEGVINFRLQVTLLPPPATTQMLLHADISYFDSAHGVAQLFWLVLSLTCIKRCAKIIVYTMEHVTTSSVLISNKYLRIVNLIQHVEKRGRDRKDHGSTASLPEQSYYSNNETLDMNFHLNYVNLITLLI